MGNLRYNYPVSPQVFLEEVTGHCYEFDLDESIECQVRKILKQNNIHMESCTLAGAFSRGRYQHGFKWDFYLVDLTDSFYNEVTEEWEQQPDYRFISVDTIAAKIKK